jgi:hypothetical protein
MRSQVILRIRFVDGDTEVERAMAILRRGRLRAIQRMLLTCPDPHSLVETPADS